MAKQYRSRNRLSSPRFLISVTMAGVFIVIFVVTLVAPGGTATQTTTNLDQDAIDFSTPIPTVFAPPPPSTNISLNAPQVQRNGLFQIQIPTGWIAAQNTFDPSLPEASMFFENRERFSSIHALVQFGVNYESPQALADDFFVEDYFFSVWQNYSSFNETSRLADDERIVLEFSLVAQEIEYLARQISWLDGDWLYSLRLIAPANNPNLLATLESEVMPTFIGYDDQREFATALTAYADFEAGYLVRYSNFRQVAATVGAPAVFESFDESARLIARTFDETPLGSLEDAESYFADRLHPESTLIASQVTEREYGAGFLISYEDRDSEGNPISGLIALLNDESGTLYTADLQYQEAGVDFLAADLSGNPAQLKASIETFMILPPATDPASTEGDG